MSGFLSDTNVLLDIATADPIWLGWSENQPSPRLNAASVFHGTLPVWRFFVACEASQYQS